MVYIAHSTDKVFLSREACTALSMIPENFPDIGGTNHTDSMTAAAIPLRQPQLEDEKTVNAHINASSDCTC